MSDKLKHRKWYAYIGGNPLIPESYQLATVTPTCKNGRNLVAIYTRGYDEQPDELSTSMKTHISNALLTGMAQPGGTEVPLVVLK